MHIEAFHPCSRIDVRAHRRESHFMREIAVIDLDAAEDWRRAPIVARIYGSARGARNYACIWIHRGDNHATGSGYAGGCGYHRPSAALQAALESAGVKLSERIDGVGDGAMRSALLALAAHLGVARPYLYIAHP